MSESLLQKVSGGTWRSQPPSWDGLQPWVVLWRRIWRMYLRIFTRSCKITLASALRQRLSQRKRWLKLVQACTERLQKCLSRFSLTHTSFAAGCELRTWQQYPWWCNGDLPPKEGPPWQRRWFSVMCWIFCRRYQQKYSFLLQQPRPCLGIVLGHGPLLSTHVFQSRTSSTCECWGLVLTSEQLLRTVYVVLCVCWSAA